MDYKVLFSKISERIKRNPSLDAYNDLYSLCKDCIKEDSDLAIRALKWASKRLEELIPNWATSGLADRAAKMMDIHKKILRLLAPYDFESYMLAVEFNRPVEEKFYLPRRHYLTKIGVIDAYQEVADGKLKLLTISLPKRGGKSQTGINYVCWMSGREPNRSTLMEGTGDDLVRSFYSGCLEYLDNNSEYDFRPIFPGAPLVQTNADSKIINLSKKSRFPTIMCRSIDSRQVGLSEATNLLYLDDCVEGREEAKNRQRLDDKWEVISGDVIGRAVEGTPIVACGTRYSLYDPIGRLQDEAIKQGWTWKSIEVPALDLITDESNYEYYNPKLKRRVFTTAYFREQRALLSAEQFESEFQQHPFEAKGLLFPEGELNRYFKLPSDNDPDAVIAVCDTAEGGGDSVMMPVAYIYGDDVFIEDCVFDNSTPEHTKPECANLLVKHKVSVATFESNNAGSYYARDVEDLVNKAGGKCSIRTKRTITNKNTRIEMASDNILKHFYFKDKSLYAPGSQYGQMMRELIGYTRTGKVAHDDSPDGLALLENEIRNLTTMQVQVIKRPF